MATAMKRTKRAQVQAAPVLRNNDELNDALRDLCDIQSRVSAREAELQQKITALREEADNDLADDLGMDARLRKDVEEYCTYYREDIFQKGRKSLELAHGKVDFLQHRPAVTTSKRKRMTWALAIENIRSHFGRKAEQYLRVKVEPNKETLVTLDEEVLDTLGLEIQRKETFGISLNLESVAPASTSTSRQ